MYQLTPEQLKTLGITPANKKEADEMAENVGKNIFKSALTELMENFSQPELAAFDAFVEYSDSLSEVLTFLKQRYPEFSYILKNHEQKFINECKEELSKVS